MSPKKPKTRPARNKFEKKLIKWKNYKFLFLSRISITN